MKSFLWIAVASTLLLISVSAQGLDDFPRGNPYGAQRPYGRHPGIDFMVRTGTPVIAPADGKVTEIRKFEGSRPWQGGWIVRISHADQSHSQYLHLSEIYIELGQSLTRGQLIGLSGARNSGKAHLHFCICASAGRCIDFSETLDPDNFWLGSSPQCFRPGNDYSRHTKKGTLVLKQLEIGWPFLKKRQIWRNTLKCFRTSVIYIW